MKPLLRRQISRLETAARRLDEAAAAVEAVARECWERGAPHHDGLVRKLNRAAEMAVTAGELVAEMASGEVPASGPTVPLYRPVAAGSCLSEGAAMELAREARRKHKERR